MELKGQNDWKVEELTIRRNFRKCQQGFRSMYSCLITGMAGSASLPDSHIESSSMHPVSHLSPPGSLLNGKTVMWPHQ